MLQCLGMLSTMLCALPFLSTLATALAIDDALPPTIQNASFAGNGCPPDSFSYTFSPYPNTTTNTYAFTFGLGDEINPNYGPGTRALDRRKKCEITINLKSEGSRVRVNHLGTVVAGWSRLGEKGTVLTAMVSYGFSGDTVRVLLSLYINTAKLTEMMI